MTFATSHSDSPIRRRGFSLTEILIVIGIIVVLVGILLPTVIKAYSQANKTRSQYDLQMIGTALEAYKSDFGDYPRTDPVDASTVKGGHVLCRALFAPGPQADVAANDKQGDGAAGLGFRVRPGGSGKVYGPYLQGDRFIIDDDTTAGNAIANYAIVQIYTKDYTPILYYPRNPRKPDPTVATSYVWNVTTANYYTQDNVLWMPVNSICALLGDYSLDGKIDSTYGPERAIDMPAYLLISTGADNLFSSTAIVAGNSTTGWATNKSAMDACDDVTNFTR